MFDPSSLPSDDEIIESYITAPVLGELPDDSEPCWPEAFRILNSDDPERAWSLIYDLIKAIPDALLPNVAAHQLENFLNKHASDYIDRIENRSQVDDRFADALALVWITKGFFEPEIELRLVRASRGRMRVLNPY